MGIDSGNAGVYEDGNVIVNFRRHVKRQEAEDLITRLGLKALNWIGSIRFMLVEVPTGEELKWISEFTKSDLVGSANLNYIKRTC